MNKTTKVLLLSTTLLAQSAFAVTQNFTINVGQHLKGSNTLSIKKMIKQKYGKDKLTNFELEKVTLSAKSKDGKADTNLQVGHSETYPQKIKGTPEKFKSSSLGFSSLSFSSPSRRTSRDETWKVHLKGNVKVDKLKVKTKLKLDYNPSKTARLSFAAKKSFTVNKVIGSTKTINPGNNFKAIKLSASGKVSITEVQVKFKDGQTVVLEELNGKLRSARTFMFQNALGKTVQSIKVSAVSTNIFGSRAKLTVSTAKKVRR